MKRSTNKLFMILPLLLYIYVASAQHIDWATLQVGDYPVGYQSSWGVDYSRAVVYKGDTINRPILINIWYPAQDDQTNTWMTYEDYFDIESSDPKQESMTKHYRAYNLSILMDALSGKSPEYLDETEKHQWHRFLQKEINVKKDVKSAKGQFPLVIYHQGHASSFEDNSVLAEFLASCGYVVVGSSFFRENCSYLGIDGGSQSVTDISYLINLASHLDYVDIDNIAVVGHSGGAQAAVLAKASTMNLIKAIVSIETTQETYGLADTRWDKFTRPVLADLSNMTGALLAFADHKAIFQLYDLMSGMDRYYVTFPESLDHDEYISQGIHANYWQVHGDTEMIDEVPDVYSQAKSDLLNYTKVNSYILTFLDWNLKNKRPSGKTFVDSPYSVSADFSQPWVQTVPLGAIGPVPYSLNQSVPPTPRQIWQLARANTIDSLLNTLKYFIHTKAAHPIYQELFAFSLVSQLVEEDEKLKAQRLFDFYQEEDIAVAKRFISLSKFSVMMGKKKYARKCLANLLQIDPENAEAIKELQHIDRS